MAAITLFCQWIEVNISELSKEEVILLEAEVFSRLCIELEEFFRKQHQEYFSLMKFCKNKENSMLETNFVRFIIKDTLATGEYDMMGIANYTDTHEDVIQEVIDGRNTNPSAILLRKSIEIHRSVRRELYNSILKKISNAWIAVA